MMSPSGRCFIYQPELALESAAESTMSSYQKITLTVPLKLLQQLERIAAQRQISISQLLTQALEEMAAREDEFEQARARHLASLEHAAELGTYGHATWSRDSLHDR